MKPIKPVSVANNSFNFCKVTIALILWISFIFKIKWLVYLNFSILLLSAILKVERAPLVVLYSQTVERLLPSRSIILDENAIKFAHTAGAVMTFIASLAITFIQVPSIWYCVLIIAILKTSGAFGYCSALKLYTCMSSDNCCKTTKYISKTLRRQ